MLSGKFMIICLIAGYIKEISLYKLSCFRESDSCNRNRIKVELDLSNYAKKYEVKDQHVLKYQNLLKRLF